MKKLIVIVLCLMLAFSLIGCGAKESPVGDRPPMITIYGKNFMASHMPTSELPEGYEYIGNLPEEAANDTGLAGCKMYAVTELDTLFDFYLFQECGTPISGNTIDSTQRQWAYVQWICQNNGG